ncbi:hypothetical protein [Aquimarina longa]|uniref:hypothetical protein n=1 Tax=Aquimarina longa TaxID=1080221 RepID=UPI0007854B2E|nr:hypothetical protein [Aquimarina longa]
MKIHLSIVWSENALYNSGEREIKVNWKKKGLPRQGETINISYFIEKEYTPNERFTYQDKERNVFDWIENTSGWEVENVKWDCNNGTTFLHVLVGDKRVHN